LRTWREKVELLGNRLLTKYRRIRPLFVAVRLRSRVLMVLPSAFTMKSKKARHRPELLLRRIKVEEWRIASWFSSQAQDLLSGVSFYFTGFKRHKMFTSTLSL